MKLILDTHALFSKLSLIIGFIIIFLGSTYLIFIFGDIIVKSFTPNACNHIKVTLNPEFQNARVAFSAQDRFRFEKKPSTEECIFNKNAPRERAVGQIIKSPRFCPECVKEEAAEAAKGYSYVGENQIFLVKEIFKTWTTNMIEGSFTKNGLVLVDENQQEWIIYEDSLNDLDCETRYAYSKDLLPWFNLNIINDQGEIDRNSTITFLEALKENPCREQWNAQEKMR